jgi:hypothetical protein
VKLNPRISKFKISKSENLNIEPSQLAEVGHMCAYIIRKLNFAAQKQHFFFACVAVGLGRGAGANLLNCPLS